MRLGGHALVDVLAATGITRFYGVPGESFLEIMDGVANDARLRLISTRHESGASFAAEADARISGIPAVAMATRGVGAANLAIGVFAAKQSSTPLIALVGDVTTPHQHREAFQEVDLAAFYRPITKWSARVPDASRMADMAAHAVRIATTGRPGPVMLSLPADLLAVAVEAADPALLQPIDQPRPQPSPTEAAAAAQLLNGARRPVLIVGAGAQHAREMIVDLAEAFSLGVYTAFRQQDAFPNDHPQFLGPLGIAPEPTTIEALNNADVALVIGSRLDEITTQGFELPGPATAVIHIDVDAAVVGASMTTRIGMVADAGAAARCLIGLAAPERRDHGPGHTAWERSTVVGADRATPGGPLDPAQVVARMAQALPADAIVTNDAGNFAAFLHRHWRFTHPQCQLGPISGAMGYAVPAALGARLADPTRAIVAVAGDGGFLMTGAEIETAVRTGAAFVTVVFRNGLYGTIAMHQAAAYGHIAGCDIGVVDPAGFARSLGATGVTVTALDEVGDAIQEALRSDLPTVIDVPTDPDLIAPGRRLSDLLNHDEA